MMPTKTDKRIDKLADSGLIDDQRLRLLAIAFNIPFKLTTAGTTFHILPTELAELEDLLKKHYRK